MKRKSKIATFILSLIPGLGHVYLNQALRGLIFFVGAAGVILLSIIYMEVTTHFRGPLPLLLLPVVWLAGLVDSLVLVDRINEQEPDNGVQSMTAKNSLNEAEMEKQNKNRKLIAMLLSIIPGAGQMYLEFQRQGLQLMTIFFFTIFISDWLRLSFLMFIVPLVWFYSLFDTLQKASGEEPVEDHDILLVSWLKGEKEWGIIRHKMLGYGLIIIGAILILNRIAFPAIAQYISWQLSQYLQTGVVALLLILGGIKLLLGERAKTTLDQPAQLEQEQPEQTEQMEQEGKEE